MDSGSSGLDDAELEYKVVILGNGSVGKTSLIKRYCDDGFGQSYKQTIGLDFYSKKVELPGSRHVLLQIWDIGGQQLGGSMINNYIHDTNAVCFVYDVTNADSFKDMEDWYQCVVAAVGGEAPPLMILVGNKTDLPNRQVTAAMHALAADMHQMDSFLISARSGERVNALFTKIAARLSGVNVTREELEMVDRVVATVESRPEDRVAVFHATQVGTRKTKVGKDECVLM
ncbi:putative small GTP-binding protein Rab28 [Trypanosoma grayi]|uniref:putative small GTP-binding protein Rab28 n=1 Tax=Trypanosoma grayi TaxID=71804 RepID=UPI0004F4A2F8|nr:putative small GTP-binding protein Rab28 [Trypanosoma grayi]KEG14077.1 putative small GTP-binding protein Rab28 [Trypanosoma grayi]